jgi:predicted DNA-binding transcriptional regulator AlpA
VNRQELVDLPPAVDVQTAAAVLGLSRTAAYELIRVGGWPTPVLRLGRLIRVPTAPLLALLGVEAETQGAMVATRVERQAVK